MPSRLDAIIGVAAAVPLLSALRSPAYPLGIRIGLAVLWVASAWRPGEALALLALIVPFGTAILTSLDAPPVRLAEAMVLATLSGSWTASLVRSPEVTRRKFDAWSALLFGAVVLASLVVVLGAREVGVRSPSLEARNLALYLTHDYLVGPAPEFAGVTDAFVLLEGVALMWTVRRYASGRTAWVVGGLIAASIVAVALSLMQVLASDAAASSVVTGLLHARASGPVSDVNAIGSFFAMTALVVLAVAIAKHGRRGLRIGAVLLTAALLGGVWLSGSRMALVAAIGGATLLTAQARLTDRYRRWSVVLFAAAAAIVLIALTVGLDPRPSASRTVSNSFSRRADFLITGVRMIASAPVFGVGIGRYFEMSGSFMPDSIYWFYFHENAHNNFLQIGGELGVAGLAAFLWMLGLAGRRLGHAMRARPDDGLLVGSAVGAGAFVVTWLTSYPLLVPEVAYAFWMVLGAALGRADAIAATPAAEAPAPSRHASAIFAAAAALLFVSVPLRIHAAQPSQSLDRVSFGFYDWENDNGFPYRWTSRRATFFIPATSRQLDLPVRSMMVLGHLEPVTFSVAVGGRVLDMFPITQGNWQTVRLRLPPAADSRSFTRIDVLTDPAWTPAATGANEDVRVLGVQLGHPHAQ